MSRQSSRRSDHEADADVSDEAIDLDLNGANANQPDEYELDEDELDEDR